jgi:hypothetical protein
MLKPNNSLVVDSHLACTPLILFLLQEYLRVLIGFPEYLNYLLKFKAFLTCIYRTYTQVLMSITIAKQVEPYTRNSHDNACIVGTKIHLYYNDRLIRATKNEPRLMSNYNLDETKLRIFLLLADNQACEKEYAAK